MCTHTFLYIYVVYCIFFFRENSGLATEARAKIRLEKTKIPSSATEGLHQYSHIWILYIFHLNTNLHRDNKKVKGKVQVRDSNPYSILIMGVKND